MERMILAKMLYENGISATANLNDRLRFAMGIISFHDAVELSLGAIADHLNIPKMEKAYMMDYIGGIQNQDSERRKIPCSQQLKTLNTLRNNIKHQGITPDPEANKHLPNSITTFFHRLCSLYLDLDFNQITLIELIASSQLKKLLIDAQSSIQQHQYTSSLEFLSLAMYNLIEKDFLESKFTGVLHFERKVIYPESEGLNFAVKLLENGVDLKLYKNVHALIPQVGLNLETNETVYLWDKNYSHEGNWTEENVRMCLDFVIDLALKFQKSAPFSFKHYSEMYRDKIEPLEDNVVIMNNQNAGLNSRPLPKGQHIIGMVHEFLFRDDLWLVEDLGDEPFTGTVFKSQVKVTRILKS